MGRQATITSSQDPRATNHELLEVGDKWVNSESEEVLYWDGSGWTDVLTEEEVKHTTDTEGGQVESETPVHAPAADVEDDQHVNAPQE